LKCYTGVDATLHSIGLSQERKLSLAGVHDIFHVSHLKKCLKSPVDIMFPEVTPLKDDLSYPEHPIKVLDQKDCVHKTIKFLKM
jgi:hypothetical protein